MNTPPPVTTLPPLPRVRLRAVAAAPLMVPILPVAGRPLEPLVPLDALAPEPPSSRRREPVTSPLELPFGEPRPADGALLPPLGDPRLDEGAPLPPSRPREGAALGCCEPPLPEGVLRE